MVLYIFLFLFCFGLNNRVTKMSFQCSLLSQESMLIFRKFFIKIIVICIFSINQLSTQIPVSEVILLATFLFDMKFFDGEKGIFSSFYISSFNIIQINAMFYQNTLLLSSNKLMHRFKKKFLSFDRKSIFSDFVPFLGY